MTFYYNRDQFIGGCNINHLNPVCWFLHQAQYFLSETLNIDVVNIRKEGIIFFLSDESKLVNGDTLRLIL